MRIEVKNQIILRDYQQECINSIPEQGNYLIQMATGLGKTATFTNIPRRGKVLILAHREELIYQPIKYYKCPVGIEMASQISNGEEVIIASVQSLIKRLDKFRPDHFDMLITDEAHHAAAQSYKKIYEYFRPRLHLGFTATPGRGDDVRLDDVYHRIIFERSLQWGVKNKYLCNIECLRANIGYDLSQISRRMGDFAVGELENALNTEKLNRAIADTYFLYAVGQTLIFATSVKHAEDIAKEIPGAVVVSAETKKRAEIIKAFTNREIPCLVNCMVFTEGTDIPLIETIIIARPTQNISLYQQMVGRGLRLYPGKEKLTLIDLVGVTGRFGLCSAPSLLGYDLETVPKHKQDEIQGDLFDLPDLITKESDCIESWIKNVKFVDVWAREQNYNTHNINFFKMPNGDLTLSLPTASVVIPAQDELGNTFFNKRRRKMQSAIDLVFKWLQAEHKEEEYIWNVKKAKRSWGYSPASPAQIDRIKQNYRGEIGTLNKFEASQVLNRLTRRVKR
jgi:superfamily II DNA or RNA helicase